MPHDSLQHMNERPHMPNIPEVTDMAQNALHRMQKARADLLLSHPFFGSLALKLTLKADTACPNLWTDGTTLAYNPHFISVLSHEHVMAAQAHEILHIACEHHIRRQGRDETLWNKACDYAIGALLQEAGFSLPEALHIHDKDYDDMSVDAIYEMLSVLEGQETHGGAEHALTSESTDKTDDASAGDGNTPEGMGTEVENAGKKAAHQEHDTDAHDDAQKKQSTSNEARTEHDQGTHSSKLTFFGEIKDHPFLSRENDREQRKAEEDALIHMTQAMQSAQGHGDVPLGLVRLYNKRIRPQLDWNVLLQQFLENCFDGDYSWSMPNRRYISQNIYLPSRKELRIPTIALAIDSSGSVDDALLALFCAELENILESFDTHLFIMYHDVKVHKHDFYTRLDRPLHLHVRGGGGTSYTHVPEYIEQENIQPACLLWFTDFECTLFPQEPHYPVLWIGTKHAEKKPPFGDVIALEAFM